MKNTQNVNAPASERAETVGTRYPVERIKLLEAVQARRKDATRADTIRHALDRLIDEHFPGSVGQSL